MPHAFLAMLILLTAVLAGVGTARGSGAPASGGVVINGQPLSEAELEALRATIGSEVPAARYWYDRISGWWGYEGGPIEGTTTPGLDLGGRLAPDASRGTSGVFINGRQLPEADQLSLAQKLNWRLPPGHYWVDASGQGGLLGAGPMFVLGGPGSRYPNSNTGSWSTNEHEAESTEWPGFRLNY